MKSLIIFDTNYPNETNLYGDVFVHVRVKEYAKIFKVQVIGVNKKLSEKKSFVYESVPVVIFNNREEAEKFLFDSSPSILLVHFFEPWMYKRIVVKADFPILIWVHGVEALGWYRRLFTFTLKSIKTFLYYIVTNTYQMIVFNQLVKYSNKNKNIGFIFVSNWMKRITESDCLRKIKTSYIIPNPIDIHLFPYKEKEELKRKRILAIRSFESKKYATDLIQKVIFALSKKSYFNELEFAIYGKGKFFIPHTKDLIRFKNVKINNTFIEYSKISSLHEEYGVFLCPTRQDAQGVSMCEAMSSGLIPITSNSTAIPEFVQNCRSGFLAGSIDEMVNYIEQLYYDQDLFKRISFNAHFDIINKASLDIVVKKEIQLIESYLLNEK